jgi:hypothetical protein
MPGKPTAQKLKRATHGTLTMNREGLFSIRATGPNHCGTQELLGLRYSVKVECAATVDARGFLFDQINIDSFFQKIKATQLSCEQFAIDCSRKLWKTIMKENPDCIIRRLEVTLSPEPFAASMTFCFDRARDGKQ